MIKQNNMAQQTAVEWLQELYDSRPAYEEFIMEDEFEQAKEMEKKQIIDAVNGYTQIHYVDVTPGEKYYKETYNK